MENKKKHRIFQYLLGTGMAVGAAFVSVFDFITGKTDHPITFEQKTGEKTEKEDEIGLDQ